MHNLPEIVVGRADYDVLFALASAGSGAAEELMTELERAQILDDEAVPANIVRMGSTVGYTVDGGEPTIVTLVLPSDADISKGAISVLTPIGAALIGLRPGQSINWTTRDGRDRILKVVTVFSETAKPAADVSVKHTHVGFSDDPGPSAA